MKLPVYNLEGKEVGQKELDPKYFGVEVKPELVQQSVEAQLANSRTVLAHTKGTGDVRGGGKKPWRQKGTGRARHGTIRSALWRGGGVTFGPTKERNFAKSINKKAKTKALFMALSDKVSHQRLVLVDDLNLAEAKTKKFKEILDKLPLKAKTALIILDKKNENVIRSSRNLPAVLTESLVSLNIVDLLKHEYLLLPEKTVAKLVKHFSK